MRATTAGPTSASTSTTSTLAHRGALSVGGGGLRATPSVVATAVITWTAIRPAAPAVAGRAVFVITRAPVSSVTAITTVAVNARSAVPDSGMGNATTTTPASGQFSVEWSPAFPPGSGTRRAPKPMLSLRSPTAMTHLACTPTSDQKVPTRPDQPSSPGPPGNSAAHSQAGPPPPHSVSDGPGTFL